MTWQRVQVLRATPREEHRRPQRSGELALSASVVACAIALWRGEPFADDRAALRIFGAHPETKIREAWVSKKIGPCGRRCCWARG